MPDDPAHLPAEAVQRLLSIVEQDGAVVIGGQAVSIWAEHYRRHIPDLFMHGPLTSKDLDFFRNDAAVKSLVRELNAREYKATMDDNTPSAAKVVAVLMGRSIEIDFLNEVKGVDEEDVPGRRVILSGEDYKSDRIIKIPVMHPLDCVWSRFANINKLKRMDSHSWRQGRASLLILARFIIDAIEMGEISHAQEILMELCYLIKSEHQGKATHLVDKVRLNPEHILHAFKNEPAFDERWRELTFGKAIGRVDAALERLWRTLRKDIAVRTLSG